MPQTRYRMSAHTGIIAASLNANSVLFHWRNPPTLSDGSTNTTVQKLHMIYLKWRTITGYTTGQELSLACYEVTAFGASPADYTGGTDLSHPSTDANKAYSVLVPDARVENNAASRTVLQSGNVMIATTAGLSHVGSPTIKTHPFAWESVRELDTGSTVPRGAFDLVWTPDMGSSDFKTGFPLVPAKGFVIRNPIALGAGGTGRMFVEIIWSEG